MSVKAFRKELGFAVGVTALSAWFAVQSFSYPESSSQFPRSISAAMLVLSVVLLLRILAKRPASTKKADVDSAASRPSMTPLAVFVSIALYIVALQYLGYIVATVLYMLGSMAYFGQKRFAVSLLVTVLFVAFIYLMFVRFFGLRLPEGVLF